MADSFLKSLNRIMTGGVPLYQTMAGVLFGTLGGFSSGPIATIVVGATPTPNLALSNAFQITLTANTVMVFQIPTGVPAGSMVAFTITIINTSGGNLTNITFAAAYKQAALTFPATANNRTYGFYTNGTNAWETFQTAADVGN